MAFFAWLEGTRIALWVGESLWGYPLLLGLHVIGLAVVVGIFAMLDLRLLGVARSVEVAAFRPLFGLAWTGLLINAVSGVALFSSQATTFVHSTPFLVKLAAIALGVALAVLIRRRLFPRGFIEKAGAPSRDRPLRGFAIASLVCWGGAIVAGRLIAYL